MNAIGRHAQAYVSGTFSLSNATTVLRPMISIHCRSKDFFHNVGHDS